MSGVLCSAILGGVIARREGLDPIGVIAEVAVFAFGQRLHHTVHPVGAVVQRIAPPTGGLVHAEGAIGVRAERPAVQEVVQLHGDAALLLVSNPVFGLDFAAVKEIHTRLRGVRNHGGAVLLISEDLDELLELADRIVVMSEGRFVFETSAADAKRAELGAHMGGGHHDTSEQSSLRA